MSSPRQLPFDLPVAPRMGPDDLVVGAANEAAVAYLERWPDWPTRVAVLAGPRGSGKTHLAGLWAERAGARMIEAADLPSIDPVTTMEAGPLVVENAGLGIDETALFHLINATNASASWLLITSREPAASWGVILPDLASRLRAASPLTLAEPDDALLEAVLAKLFADRQAIVDPQVLGYLARRMHRSYAVAIELVEALDREALATKTAITRATVQRVLQTSQSREPELDGLDDDIDNENNPS